VLTGELVKETGSSLKAQNTTMTFGKLAAPTLGTGCTGPCVEGGAERIHAELTALEVTVEPADQYSLRGTGLASILNCLFGITCVYRGENVVRPIKHDGKHSAHKGAENLPLAKFEETLARQTTHGGSSFCPATSLWRANYVLYLAGPSGEEGLAWPSLAVPVPEIVLCQKLIEETELCPEGDFFPSGTKLLALAANPEFKASPFSSLKCEDSVVEAEVTSSMGKELGVKFTKIAFGKLPTPELGNGCTTCTEGVHPPTVVNGSIEMTGEDYVLNSSEAFELLSCFGLGVTCLYGSDGLTSLIDNDAGKHKLATEEEGLAQILVSATLSLIKGSNFCPEKGTWTANYVAYALESDGKKIQGWLALYEAL
jgi:hypothetical protein